ncbi:hypothetical protein CL632_03800 [bacterium]|jgi:hypothetical protein|nr:hypothetical protein [bacterium]MDP6571776.1 glycoside hydrolase family 2 TIM barrel-domain containing protein [Patescibacteria group bacterium]|tara:strand:- start:17116 stop:18153 length:1038 start_codon:yes stop_codon:yes gene_type:complete
MKRVVRRTLKITGTSIIVLLVGFVIWFLSGEGVKEPHDITWGVSFFPKQAQELGLDWRTVYIALLDDMKVKRLRLAVPWNDVSKDRGVYDFSDIHWMLTEADKRSATVTLNVGRKLMRWPECHDPEWIYGTSHEEFDELVLEFLEDTINNLKHHQNIVMWQVENEPVFPFGECYGALPSKDLFKREVALVRSLDERPVATTDSGELASWLAVSGEVDRLGISLYRVTDNPFWGRFYYPLRPGFYQKKESFVKAIHSNLQDVFLSELQLEPWTLIPLSMTPLAEQFESMNFSRTQANVEFAKRTGFGEIYLWGVEWWYWLKREHRDARFWNFGKSLMQEPQSSILE